MVTVKLLLPSQEIVPPRGLSMLRGAIIVFLLDPQSTFASTAVIVSVGEAGVAQEGAVAVYVPEACTVQIPLGGFMPSAHVDASVIFTRNPPLVEVPH
jgi:hypothetical protein